jgi:ACS family sodium-dependent inorganic phosphate cotransporter
VCVFETHLMFLQSTIVQWRTVFWIVLGVFIVTNVLFIVMGSGELQPWNNTVPKKGAGEEARTSEQNPSTGKI